MMALANKLSILKYRFHHVVGGRSLASFQVAAPNTAPKMAPTWQEEKKRYLQMSLHDKRKEYLCGDKFVIVDDLLPWDEYILSKKHAPKKSPMPADFSINSAKNLKLCKKISIFRGDITTLEVDAIVNAANKSLLGGGGVDGAIHSAAGTMLVAENKTHGGCAIGEVKVSGGYQLPARVVISTVGPQGERPELLRKCYKNSMDMLAKLNLKTIAFPSISTGIYGYPVKPAAHVSAQEVRKALEQYDDKIDRVVFCLFSEVDEDTYSQVLPTYFPLQ